MLKAGASEFCWLNPSEVLSHGPEEWRPSPHGAFLYLMADGHAKYFPAELQPIEATAEVPAEQAAEQQIDAAAGRAGQAGLSGSASCSQAAPQV